MTSVVVHNAAVQHPRCLQTRIRLLWCCRQMWDSSVKNNFIPFCHPHPSFIAPLVEETLWFCVKSRPSDGRLAGRLLCCERRRMVRTDTE
ncbi:uncharacterized protein TNCV_2152321 [Trichonephila clavipes]|nr:uncharacterized protein TNCV_2152321 [Trichonephila clavipes]